MRVLLLVVLHVVGFLVNVLTLPLNARTDKYKQMYTRTRPHVCVVTEELQACT